MSADVFHTTYAPTSGPLRLGHWECIDANRPATRLGPQARNYQATIAIGDRISTSTAAASGPLAALTAMLHDRGIAVEMPKFHQVPAGEQSRRSSRGTDGVRDEWAMGCPTIRRSRRCEPSSPVRTGWPAEQQTSGQRSGRRTMGMPSIGTGMPP